MFYQKWNPRKKRWEATPELRQLLQPIYGKELLNHPLFTNPPKQHGKKQLQQWQKLKKS